MTMRASTAPRLVASNPPRAPRQRSKAPVGLDPSLLLAELDRLGVNAAARREVETAIVRQSNVHALDMLAKRRGPGRMPAPLGDELIQLALIFAIEGGRKRPRRKGDPGVPLHAAAKRVLQHAGVPDHLISSRIHTLSERYLREEAALVKLAELLLPFAELLMVAAQALPAVAPGLARFAATLNRVADAAPALVAALNRAVDAAPTLVAALYEIAENRPELTQKRSP
jgi:hypothetical protein